MARRTRPLWRALIVAAGLIVATTGASTASSPGADVRATHDDGSNGGYVSNYTLVTGTPYTDATLTECSQSRGRQNEPSVVMDPRDTSVLVGSSNDYCGVYNDGSDTNGDPPLRVVAAGVVGRRGSGLRGAVRGARRRGLRRHAVRRRAWARRAVPL